MKGRRSQAAFEFLTTYAWAFMMILVMIGALAYFGVLDTGKLLPERCDFPPDFICQDFELDGATDTARVNMRQNMGERIQLINATCTFRDGTTDTFVPSVADWDPKANKTITCSSVSPDNLYSGDKSKVLIELVYRIDTGGYDHTAEGEVYGNTR